MLKPAGTERLQEGSWIENWYTNSSETQLGRETLYWQSTQYNFKNFSSHLTILNAIMIQRKAFSGSP